MIMRNYHIQVKLEIHAITCPGVSLCPNGGVELTIRTLGYFLTTNQAPARFPIIFHDVFHLEGYFKTVNSLAQLEDSLRNEKVNIAMWQNGRRLAHCCKTLYSFLLDRPFKVTSQSYNRTIEMDGSVILTPSSCFPGIIGPKVEYMSRVKLIQPDYDLNEREGNLRKGHICNRKGGRKACDCESSECNESCDVHNVNSHEFRRQKPVCHYSEKDKRHHSERQHRNFSHKNFESKKIHCDCVCDFDDSSSVKVLVENHSHQHYQYPHHTNTMGPVPPPSGIARTMKNHENFNELKTVTNTAQPIMCHCITCPHESKSNQQLQQQQQQNIQRAISNSPSISTTDLESPNCCEYLKELHDKCRRYLSETDHIHSSSACTTCIKYHQIFNLK